MRNEIMKIFLLLGIVLLYAFVVVAAPVFTIWSVNVLFDFQIPVTFRTWVATAWLLTVFHTFRFSVNSGEATNRS